MKLLLENCIVICFSVSEEINIIVLFIIQFICEDAILYWSLSVSRENVFSFFQNIYFLLHLYVL